MLIRRFSLEGLGHLSALVADEAAGLAVVVDPRRDVDAYLAAAAELDVRISHVLETHLHNDYVSGGRELAAATGAEQVIGAGAELRHAVPRGPSRRGVGGRVAPVRRPRDAGPHARARRLRGGRHLPRRRADRDVHRRLAPRRRCRPDGPPRRGARPGVRPGDAPLAPRGDPPPRGLRWRLPDPRRGLALLDRDLGDARVDDRLRASARSAPRIAGSSTPSPGRSSPASRRSRATSPGCARPTRRVRGSSGRVPAARPMSPAAVRDAVDAAVRWSSMPAAPEAHVAAHLPGSLSIPVGSSFGTWLGWVVDRSRPSDRARPRASGRLGRRRPPGPSDRLRRRARRPSPGRGRARGPRRVCRSEAGGELDVHGLARAVVGRRPRRAARDRRPTAGRVRVRSRVPGALADRRRRAAGSLERPPARPADRHDLRQRLPGERRGVAAPGRRVRGRLPGSPAASRPGPPRAIRSSTARPATSR